MKKKRKWIRRLILLAAAAVCMAVSQQTKSAQYVEETVVEGDLTTYYNFDGLVYAARTQTLTASQDDTVRAVYVAQNQHVNKGDRIYRLENGAIVKADIAGEVTGLYIEEGDVVSAGEVAAQIIDMDRLEVRLDVDEYDIAAAAPGNEVSVSVLATNAQFDSYVSALDKNGIASGDLSYYTATVPMDEMENVYPGMQVSAKVLREHVEGAALLHVDAVQFDEYNMPYVYTASQSGEPVRTDVTVGASDGVYCEITSGVQAGKTILVPSGMSMQEIMAQVRENSPMGR